MDGYYGAYLWIDASRGSIARRPISDEVLAAYLGGVGLGTWLLMHETPAGVNPYSPEAAIVLALSPLVGTPLTTSAKFAVVGKSPLSLRICDALSSSHFALTAKKCGGDAIVVRGRASQWSALVIDDGRLTVVAAADLLGRSSQETQERLREKLGGDFSVLAIGPAGERCVRYATISHDGRHAGRGGLGAVLGAKRIKAIAVRGTQRVHVADPAAVVRIAKDLSQRSLGPATAKYRELGTVANLLTFNRLSALPTRNFRESTFEGAEAISGESLAAVAGRVRRSCAACTIGCEHVFPVAGGGNARLEYESLFALGSLCGVGDPDAILQAVQRCDEVGIDTISFGGTFAFACECVERGLLAAPADCDLRFGSGPGLLEAIGLVARRQGIGGLLAKGSRHLAGSLGNGAIDFAPQVKGLELPGYEPRTLQMMALGLAVAPRGADHNRSNAYEVDFSDAADRLAADPRKVGLAIDAEDRAALFDSLILCKFLRRVFDDIYEEAAGMLSSVTGLARSAADLRQSAAGIVRLKRAYNEREGWSRAEDTLPRRLLEEPVTGGVAGGTRLTRERLDGLIAEYYRLRGLTSEGRLPVSEPVGCLG